MEPYSPSQESQHGDWLSQLMSSGPETIPELLRIIQYQNDLLSSFGEGKQYTVRYNGVRHVFELEHPPQIRANGKLIGPNQFDQLARG